MPDTWINVAAATPPVRVGPAHAATNTAALNALIAGLKSAGTGGTLYFPAGKYFFDGPIVIDDTAGPPSGREDLLALNRLNFKGDGAQASELNYQDPTGGAGAFVIYEGTGFGTGTGPQPAYGYFSFESLRIQRDAATHGFNAAAYGLSLFDAAFVALRDVTFEGWGTACYLQDSYNILLENCAFFGNLLGVFGQGIFSATGTLSPNNPNSLAFLSCEFANNFWGALSLVDCGGCSVVGGAINNNGTNGVTPASPNPTSGVAISNANAPPNEASTAWGFAFEGVLFESNSGLGDILLHGGGTNALEGPTGLLVKGCTFSRTSAGIAPNCIRVVLDTGTYPTSLVLIGNGFANYGNRYTPSAATPYVSVVSGGAPYQVTDWGNIYAADVERPSFRGPIQGANALASAWVTFAGGTGAMSQGFNVAGVTRNGPGSYTIAFQRSMLFRQNTDHSTANTEYAVSGSLGGIGFLATAAKTAGSVGVLTYDQAGAAKDFASVSVVCHGGNSMI